MYENESNKVKAGVEFLSALMEKDYRNDPSFDPVDLAEKMMEIADDIKSLRDNFDYEVADDVVQAREELADDTLEEDELEDEIVECDNLIEHAINLFGDVRKRYFPLEESNIEHTTDKINLGGSRLEQMPVKKKRVMSPTEAIFLGFFGTGAIIYLIYLLFIA